MVEGMCSGLENNNLAVSLISVNIISILFAIV